MSKPSQTPSFSSKECHIGIIKQPESLPEKIKVTSDNCINNNILKAIDWAIINAKMGGYNVTVPLTFPFYTCVVYDDYCKILDFIQSHNDTTNLDASSNRSIKAYTTNGYHVTVNFHGEAVFLKPQSKDDSFESVESLTQRVKNIDIKTPKIQKKVISGSRRSIRR